MKYEDYKLRMSILEASRTPQEALQPLLPFDPPLEDLRAPTAPSEALTMEELCAHWDAPHAP